MSDRQKTSPDSPPLAVAIPPLSVSFEDAERLSGIPERSIRDDAKAGKLAVVRYRNGRHRARYVILLTDLEAYLRSMRVTQEDSTAQPIPSTGRK